MDTGKVVVIGSGFAGLSAACFLAQAGFDVHVIEKHASAGGRARQLNENGFVFDMGPSWYWMPDVFERFFRSFNVEVQSRYELTQLDPGFSMIFQNDEVVNIPAKIGDIYSVFDSLEHGAGRRLKKFLDEGKYKYEIGMKELVYKPGLQWNEYLDKRLFRNFFSMGIFESYASHIRKFFKDPRLIRILEFPVLFLGGAPSKVPALYSLMAYGGLSLGTWYPKGGMYRIVEAMFTLAQDLGVKFSFDNEVTQIHVRRRNAEFVETTGGLLKADYVIASADYHHVEQHLLKPEYRMYSENYWAGRTMAPSALIFYLGISKKVPRLHHHNLFFDADFEAHLNAIYSKPALPTQPLFYVCAPSVTDDTVAPVGCENLFILVPLSSQLVDTEDMRQACFEKVMFRLELHTGTSIREHLLVIRSYAMRDFNQDYHAYRGNAYGLANTLTQTAMLKPKMKSSKVDNLYFAGQLTVPGPGVPPALISGEIAARLILKSSNAYNKKEARYATATI